MLETRNICYIDVHKTGGSHVTKIFKKILKESIYFAQHQQPINDIHFNNIQRKISFTTLRNPWDWYVSMWRYGCITKEYDVFYSQILAKEESKERYYCDDLNNVEIFQNWFFEIYDCFTSKVKLGQKVYVKDQVGIYSSWMYLQVKYPLELLGLMHTDLQKMFKNVIELDDAFEYLDAHIRTHCLEEELITFLKTRCRDYICDDFEEIIHSMSQKPTNISASIGERLPYTEFYNQEMQDMVRLWDRLILSKADFTFSIEEDLNYKFQR